MIVGGKDMASSSASSSALFIGIVVLLTIFASVSSTAAAALNDASSSVVSEAACTFHRTENNEDFRRVCLEGGTERAATGRRAEHAVSHECPVFSLDRSVLS